MRRLEDMFTRRGVDMRPYKGQQLHHEIEIREVVPWWGKTGRSIKLPLFTIVEEREDAPNGGAKLKFRTPRGMEVVANVEVCGGEPYVDFNVTSHGDIPPGWWFTWVTCGGGPAPAKGPFRSIEEAEEALARFRERHGYLAGTYEAAGSLRLKAYPTRGKARKADISDDGKVVR